MEFYLLSRLLSELHQICILYVINNGINLLKSAYVSVWSMMITIIIGL
jgi:hypothetical protein